MRRLTLFAIIITIFTVIITTLTVFKILPSNISSFAVILFTVLALLFALVLWLFPLSSTKSESPTQAPISTINITPTISLESLAKDKLSPSVYKAISEMTVVELKKDVKGVVKEVERAQDAIVQEQPELEITKAVSTDIDEVLHVATVSPRAALLLLSAKIEGQMRSRLQEIGYQPATNYALSLHAIDAAVAAGLIPKETASAFRDFMAVRNKVAHGAAFDVDEGTILSLVSIGIELLKVISAKKRKEPELSSSDMDTQN
ncbi:MAG TPA: hypothetical protein VF043_39770 [Ktedonobacteraceae bacterium]